jgi:hypothetical protein
MVVPPPATPSRWTISTEALWLERSIGNSAPLGFTAYNFPFNAPPAWPTHNLHTDDVLFPLEIGLRLQVTRRFDDQTALEASYWGLQQWSVGRTIYGDPTGDTVLAYSPWLQISPLLGGLNNSLGYTYNSEVHNAEINRRLPLGGYNPYWGLDWLWGFRYFHLSDDFTLSGSDLDWGANESLNYQTSNDLVGMQLGLQSVRGWDRFQLITEGKVGLLANFYTQRGIDSGGGTANSLIGFTPFDQSRSGTDVSALFELSLAARCRLNSHLWLHLGYQLYCVTGLALGPRQLGGYDHNGTVVLDGLSLGLEMAW